MQEAFRHPDVVQAATPVARRNLLKFWAKAEPAKEPLPQPKNVEFNTRDFTLETGTKNAEKVKFDPVMQADFQTQLQNSLHTLVEIYNDDAGSELFTSKRLSFLPKMMEDLCDKDDIGYKLNAGKIKDRLQKDPRVWKEAMQLIEFDLSLTEMALAIEAQVNPNELNMFLFPKGKDKSHAQASDGTMHLGIRRGKLNQMLGKRSAVQAALATNMLSYSAFAGSMVGADKLGTLGAQQGIANVINMLPVGREAVASAVNALGPAGLGAIGGAATGIAVSAAAAGLYTGARSALSHGVTIDLKHNTEFLKVIKDSNSGFSAEKTYLAKVLGVNVDDYKVVGNEVVAARQMQRSTDISRIENHFLDKVITRYNFMTNGLGIPGDKVRAVPDNYALMKNRLLGTGKLNAANYEPINTTWKKEEMDRMDALIAERRAASPRYPNSTTEMFNLMFDARRDVMDKNLNKRLREARIKKGPDQEHIKILDKKIADRANESGRLVQEKTAELRSVKTALNEVKPLLTADQTKLSTYEAARRKLDQVRQEAKSRFGVSSWVELDRELKQREDLPDEELTRLITDLQEAEQNLENTRSTIETMDNRFDAIRAHLDSLTDPVSGVDATLASHGEAPVGLSKSDFQNNSINDLLQRINLAHQRANGRFTLTGVWSETSNRNLDNRIQLLQTIAEAKSEILSPSITAPSTDLLDWKSAGITENAMRNATVESLRQELIDKSVPGASRLNLSNPADYARINIVIQQAQERFGVRSRSFEDMIALEPSAREEYNNSIARDKQILKQQSDFLRNEGARLAQEESAIDQFRNNTEIAKNYIESSFPSHLSDYQTIQSWHTILSATPGIVYGDELEPSALVGISIDDLRRRIHAANAAHSMAIGGAPSPIGWDASADTHENNVRLLLSSHTEAQVRHALPQTGNGAYDELRRLYSINEHDLLKKNPTQIIDQINRKGATRTNDEATRNFVQEAIDYEKNRMQARSTQLAAGITNYQTLNTAFTNVDMAYLHLRPDFTRVENTRRGHLLALRSRGILLSTSADLNREAAGLENHMNSLQDLPDISAALAQQNTAIESYRSALSNMTTKRQQAEAKANGSQTIAELTAIQARRSGHGEEDIRTMRESLLTEIANTQEQTDAAKGAREVTDAMSTALVTMENIGLSAATAIDLSPAALQTQPYEEILRRINQSYDEQVAAGATTPIGWPEDENTRKDNRQLVMNAIAEAKADIASLTSIHFGLGLLDYFQNVNHWVTEWQIHSMTPQELLAEIKRNDPSTSFGESDMKETIDAVRTLFDRRQAAHKGVIANIDVQDQELDRKISRAKEEVAKDAVVIQQAVRMRKEQGKILSNTHNLLAGVARGEVKLTGSPTTSTYISPQEKSFIGSTTPPLPEGVLVMLNLFTGYQSAPNRGEMAMELLNTEDFKPEALALRANYAANLGLVPPLDRDPNAVFAALETGIRTGKIRADAMFRMTTRIIDDYVQVADAK